MKVHSFHMICCCFVAAAQDFEAVKGSTDYFLLQRWILCIYAYIRAV